MRRVQHQQRRRGAIIPLIAFSLVALLGMVALAVDIGMVAIAKTQAQNAADATAAATVRTFTGQSGYNLAKAPGNGVKAAVANQILGANVTGDSTNVTLSATDVYTSGQVTIQCGGYYYVYSDLQPSTEAFKLVVPGKDSTQPYTAAIATIATTSPRFFGSVFGSGSFNVTASATAAFRPRDVALIVDLSGSMRFNSCMGAYLSGSTLAPYQGPRNKSMNADPNYPTFGHYSSASAALQGTTSYATLDVISDPGNQVYDTGTDPILATDFMSSGSTAAFTAAASTQATTPAGDNFLKSGGSYVKTVTDLIGSSPTVTTMFNWARNGYPTYSVGNVAFSGYTAGPNYWGKTFFVWPPDPRGSDLDPTVAANHANNGAMDWRQRFFFKKNTSTNTLYWLDHTNILLNPSGASATTTSATTPIIKLPNGDTTTVTENGVSVTYKYLINYAAIFQWLRNQSPSFFPSSMLTGRIQYYSSIPDPSSDTGFNARFWSQNPMTDLSERFWKDYVDFMLGQVQTGAGTYDNTNGNIPYSAYIGTGDLFSWGTVQITQTADCDYTATVNNSGGYTAGLAAGSNVTLGSVSVPNGSAANLPGPLAITGATNATPIVITSNAHGLTAGNTVAITGVLGTTNANGVFLVGTVTTNTFQIKTLANANTVGNGNYTSGGSWVPAITAATQASPIVITTGAPHGMTTGKPYVVNISGVTGNTAANGKWAVSVTSSTQYSLTGSTGNAAFTTSQTQWAEPYYYIKFGTGSTFYEYKDTNTASGILTGSLDLALVNTVANSSAVKIYTSIPNNVPVLDNPWRPRHQFWFGPQTWIDWLGNYSLFTTQTPVGSSMRWPGNIHEDQSWSCKIGLTNAITDVQVNNPADFFGLIFFNSPAMSSSGGGTYNSAMVPLGQSYANLQNSLWFPPSTVTGTATSITPYDADFVNVPRANFYTAPQMGFMLAYNMFSSSTSSLRSFTTPSTTYRGQAGGLGRKGAQRLVIFETDGDPNTSATATLNGTNSDAYYPIRIYDPTNLGNVHNEFPSGAYGSFTTTPAYAVISQICASSTASPPGYSTTRKPAQVYALGYGSLFDPANSTLAGQAGALTFLQTVQYYGGTSPDMTGSNFPTSQLIYGSSSNRTSQLQTAINNILQKNISVSLLQ